MSEVEQIEQRIQALDSRDLALFRAWFLDFDAKIWDQQIEADLATGKLDALLEEARADFEAGKATEL